MNEQDWTSIDAAADELESLVQANDLPGDHPDTLEAIEKRVWELRDAGIATDKCASLRTSARKFYADRSRRSRPMSQVEAKHWWMIADVCSIRERIRMLKAAEGK